MAPASRLLAFDSIWTYLCWFGALLAVMVFRVHDKQRQETVCDARAVELTGNPEPLVSGLTKLYAAARLPRRIATPQDRAASHPSLSRRIRDIRRAAGVQPTPLGEAVTIYSCDGSSVVSFEESGLSWQQDAGVTQAIDYSHLHELRLDAGRRDGPRLVAVSDRHRSWEMRISAAHVPRSRRRSTASTDVSATRRRRAACRLRSAVSSWQVLSLLALSIGQLTVAVVVLLASLRPARPLVAGAAGAAFTAALLAVRDGRLSDGGLAALVLGVAGAVLLTHPIVDRHQETRSARLPVAALGVLAVILLVSIVPAGARPNPAASVRESDPGPAGAARGDRVEPWRWTYSAAPGSQPRQSRFWRPRPRSSHLGPSSTRSGEIRFSSTLRRSPWKPSMRRRSIGFRFPSRRRGSCSRRAVSSSRRKWTWRERMMVR